MFWKVDSFPDCKHHVFLSHSREDHDGLVRPVAKRLQKESVECWLDREDYYHGRDSRTALKHGILLSRHAVFFITDAMLDSPRGWCVMELAYSELLQSNLTQAGGPLATTILPLFFVSQNDERLPRSVWQLIRDRGLFCDASGPAALRTWCADQILEFLRREQTLAIQMKHHALESEPFRKSLQTTPGLIRRVTAFHPKALPPA
jgi:hypothetical protein